MRQSRLAKQTPSVFASQPQLASRFYPHIVNGRSCPQIAHIDLSPAAAVGSSENCPPAAAPVSGEMEKPDLQHMTTHPGCALIIWVLPSDQFFFPSLSLT